MADQRVCAQCGATIPATAPEGICPRCLLRAGRPDQPAAVEDRDASTLAPSVRRVPVAGERLRYFGDYELVEEVARGGMGIVYRARQVSLNRTVAVKMILDGELASDEAIVRFRQEAEAAAHLQHPNIVAIHEVGEYEGRHYFSMDFVEGRSLADVIGGSPLPPSRATRYVRKIAEALHYAHLRGVLHRDLKPANVLIDADDEPRITDFGLAKCRSDDSKLTRTGAILGSPAYMPPEQAAGRGRDVGPPGDVYSLGAVLYEALTGQPPFRGQTPVDTLMRVLEDDPVPPSRLAAEVPPDLETICLRCLEKRPERRYPTARSLADDLDRFMNREPIEARPAGRARRIWTWTRRRPWFLAGVLSLLIIVLLACTYWLWTDNQFLRYRLTHPDYVRVSGNRTELAGRVRGWNTVLFFILVSMSMGFTRQSQQWRWRGVRPAPALLWGYAIVGCVGMASGAFGLATAIQAAVWEGKGMLVVALQTYAICYFGGLLMWRAVREYERYLFGIHPLDDADVSPDLTAAQRESIATSLFSGQRIQAIKTYREAAGVTLRESRRAVEAIETELFRQNPERIPQPRGPQRFVRGLAAVYAVGLLVSVALAVAAGEPHTLGGIVAFFSAAALPVASARLRRRWSPWHWAILAAMALGLSVCVLVYEVLAVLFGAVIGMVAGGVVGWLVVRSSGRQPAA